MPDCPAAKPHRSFSGGLSRRLLKDTSSMLETLRLIGFAALEVLAMFRWSLAMLLSVLGIGSIVPTFEALRRNADRQRAWASERQGRALTTTYQPSRPPAARQRGLRQLTTTLEDHSRARDLDWHLVNPAATLLGAAVPLGLTGFSFWLTAELLAQLYFGLYLYEPQLMVWFIPALLPLALAPIAARLVQRLHARWVGLMLVTDVSESLEQRVATLSASRRTALELQEAEIRRIERDLHDGAQARLVTMGMTLTQAQRLLEHDPDGARAMLAAAKEDSSAALSELRSLVRGIRPPVLADRGLVEAVRSIAAASPIDTRVVSDLSDRLVPTVETALYFAVAELLANACKHSAASEVVIDLGADDKVIEAVVTDNGLGGAFETEGGGLAGLRQRLAPFDGELELASPVGGPTVVTVRVPRPLD